ncbi:hypothetical protein [Paraburkholderia dipogonis]|uniref:hypothetical protein n=1 Tax=Paraburkholderia dipogonis TaxID=1211383 RepID=UPI0038B917ED
MKVNVYNEGPNPIRVVIDKDNVNDQQLDAGEEKAFESADDGVIEFRELSGAQEDLSEGGEV